jgi:hypothetical protein
MPFLSSDSQEGHAVREAFHHLITVVSRIAKYSEPLCAFNSACPEGFQPIRSRVLGLSKVTCILEASWKADRYLCQTTTPRLLPPNPVATEKALTPATTLWFAGSRHT